MASRRCHLRHAAIRLAPGPTPAPALATTPRPIPLIKRLIADPRTAVTRASTHANAAHLSPAFLDEVLARYSGTRLGRRQEIDGEIIEERVDALWTRALIEASRVATAPPLMRIVIGIDPPGSARPGADACGIVPAGIAEDERIYVLEDATRRRPCAFRLGDEGRCALSPTQG
jgi:phage terminase large subunit-like protein